MQDQRNPTSRLLSAVRRHFPRTHALAAGAASFALALTMFISTPDVEAKRLSLPVNLPPIEEGAATTSPATAGAETQRLRALKIEVKPGDTLSDLFQRAGVSAAEMYRLLASGSEAKQLARLIPGEKLTFHIDGDGALQSLELHRDRLNLVEFKRAADEFQYVLHQRQADSYTAYRQGEIDSSLFVAGSEAGLSHELIMEMADVFSSDIDFALDIRKGDSFSVMFEEEFLEGEKIGNGPIQAVTFTNQGKTYSAVRYVDSNGDANYYTPDGKSMRKAFIRTPVDIGRISSHFNPRRLHPIFKTRRPHNGTDYAAPRGTPVYAAGDGRVVKAGYSKANGNYVFIQHGERYMTRYLHLDKRKVRTGQRVKQRQVIGTVGSTGYATGPHLHYEFLVDGRHRNPATIVRKLPKAKSIPKSEMARFKTQTQPLLAQLENYRQPALAQRDENNDNTSVN
ncbi:peptidoglycan DD-metalloendopeptidase family protein [Microbulbifer thermotolerans]|uniref:Peptidoglycan DD-metalloendopeptidase family protein n=1 Tax=Microbulbifer thermotolerans TaxID=252514 RepID=A0AB35I0G8_MICTH|nr:peptidoglycan DD-metalloendopeptidase family protein [Microbulbifer thermotolerans]MCX2778418.1 peptidoglycan DD-metalloendopeptidase family protein [Microbulbifer thermotolerans]MCX2796187.1 peptidoglycan DD-metalloendopeptidase family protein [Microbulbifer thermotolerans]MCX2803289.1 peptidoglycan DD-metalloendopeptidase family protein [Microbulbifer thermotolerans]MCX2804457.1 peptidoglycan DD-metalloendopeptidase family protein [Microbulbifer thermotolerans]MCX2832605.1 peptidoglycan D